MTITVALGAQTPPQWVRITGLDDSVSAEVSLARTQDGVLHVFWTHKQADKETLMHTPISPEGKAGAVTTALPEWSSLTQPAAIPTPDGLTLYFGGVLGGQPASNPYNDGSLYVATGTPEANRWDLMPGKHSASTSVYVGGIAAALDAQRTPVFAWPASDTLYVQHGLDRPVSKVQVACCPYLPGLATDASTGEVVLGWSSNAKDEGLYAMSVAPRLGEKRLIPGSAQVALNQSMPITGRIGAPGVWMAYVAGYPASKSVNVWRYGSEEPVVVAKAESGARTAISAGPEGRLWVMWCYGTRCWAVRGNKAATRFGVPTGIATPPGRESTWRVKGDGTLGPLDLFLHMSGNGSTATWHTQVLPPLSVDVSPKFITGAQGASVTVTVSDVGDAVEGATVTVLGQTLTTNAAGKATCAVAKRAKPGSLSLAVTKAGYQKGAASIGVK